jgi:hypothetical protein
MFPLAGQEFPRSSDELASAIERALGEVMTFAAGKKVVTVSGDGFPAIASMDVNLDGASIKSSALPPKPVGVGDRQPGLSVETLSVSAHPIQYKQAKLELDLSGRGLVFDFDRDNAGSPLLVLNGAREGNVRASIQIVDLEAVILELATVAAKQQGVAIQELQIELAGEGPRALAAHVRVKAKKMMMSGVIHLRAHLAIDDQLNARVSNLSCTGEGMVGNAAASMLQNRVREFEGRRIALTAFSLGDVKLRDIDIRIDNAVTVTAAFGGQ